MPVVHASSISSSMHFTRLADWLAWQETLHPSVIDLGLDRVRRVLDALNWQQPAFTVITVSGTNGKGSTVAFLDSILRAAGYRTGVFTSPHLVRYNERVRVDGSEVSDAALCSAFEQIEQARGAQSLTFFEFNTLAALLVFRDANPDVVVLEVGMGGRLDATNVIDADVSIVTSVALDHCDWLGADVESIAREKAGIFRRGRPAIFGDPHMPASIASIAQVEQVPLWEFGRHFGYERTPTDWSWWSASLHYEKLPYPALPGASQFANACTALAALTRLAARLPITQAHIGAGLQAVRLPGRFQIRAGDPLWIFDVAHNPAAAQVLAQNLQSRPVPGRTIGICGILADKDISGIATQLLPAIDVWIAAGLEGARALAPEQLAQQLRVAGAVVQAEARDVVTACESALREARPGDRVVAFGSFLTVGAALQWARLM